MYSRVISSLEIVFAREKERRELKSLNVGAIYRTTANPRIAERTIAERDSRHKPTPPPKPAALVAGQYVYRDLALTPEMYNQLRGLQKKAKDLRQEVRNLRRMSQAQAHTVRETIRDTFITIRYPRIRRNDRGEREYRSSRYERSSFRGIFKVTLNLIAPRREMVRSSTTHPPPLSARFELI